MNKVGDAQTTEIREKYNGMYQKKVGGCQP
jgi:hypothetical protein